MTEGVLYGMELGSVTLKINNQHTHGARCRCTVGKEGRRRIYSYSMIL